LAEETPPPVTPLQLLADQRGRRLDHALFLTYTLDLHYVERVVLPPLRATGPRISVVADAYASRQDPRAVRWAGRSYLIGYAAGVPAFHPKLILLLGPDHADVAIGSGNLTAAGWQRNAELWTIQRVRDGRAPLALAELGDWLRNLTSILTAGPGVADALRHAADHLDDTIAAADLIDDGTRILHNLHRPILEQLPTGPTRHLGISAPFHDPGAATLHQVRDRLRPDHTTLAVQIGRTRADGPATAAALDGCGTTVNDDEPRYRHGKLIEWINAGGEHWALTGSANLTAAALRKPAGSTGNCELTVLAPAAALLPPGEPIDLTQHPTAPPAQARPPDGRPWLLGAFLHPDHVEVTLAAPAHHPVQLQVWPANADDEQWIFAADLTGSETSHTVPTQDLDPAQAEPGSRYRLSTLDTDANETISNVVFLVGPTAVEAAPQAEAEGPDFANLLHEPGALEWLLHLVERAQAELAIAETPGTAPAHERATRTARQASWSTQTRQWTATIGTALMRAVEPTHPPAQDHEAVTAVTNLDDLVDESTDDPHADHGDSDGGTLTDNGTTPDPADVDDIDSAAAHPAYPDPADLQRLNNFQRRLYGNSQRWAAAAHTQPLPVRLIGLQFALHAVGYATRAPITEAWPHLDWIDLLAEFATAVGQGDIPTGGEPAAGSLVAVALAVLEEVRHKAQSDDEETVAAEKTLRNVVAASGYLLLAADHDLVTGHSASLGDDFGYIVDPDNVLGLANRTVAPDPYHDAAERLAGQGYDVSVNAKTLIIDTDRPMSPRRLALEALAAVDPAQPAASIASTSRGRCLAVHVDRQLLLVEEEAGRTLWRLHDLHGPTAPHRTVFVGRSLDLKRWEHRRPGPLTTQPAEARELLTLVGLDASSMW